MGDYEVKLLQTFALYKHDTVNSSAILLGTGVNSIPIYDADVKSILIYDTNVSNF